MTHDSIKRVLDHPFSEEYADMFAYLKTEGYLFYFDCTVPQGMVAVRLNGEEKGAHPFVEAIHSAYRQISEGAI